MYRDENYYNSRFTFWESVTLAFLAEPRILVASDACVPSGATSPSMLVFLAEPHHPPMHVFLAEPHHLSHNPPKLQAPIKSSVQYLATSLQHHSLKGGGGMGGNQQEEGLGMGGNQQESNDAEVKVFIKMTFG